MYCGSCMHDNALAKALNQAGWDTLLVPTYTPIRTDETDATVDQVFFGGINVYLQQKIPFFRLLPRFVDRFLDSPWLIRRATSRAIEIDAKALGALTVSMLKGKQGNQRKEVKRLVSWLRDTAHPDAIILTNILIAGFIKSFRQQMPGVPVIVTLQGDDIFLESLTEPYRTQAKEQIRRIDPHVDTYLVHSQYYADFMADYLTLDRSKMAITPLGLNTDDLDALSLETNSLETFTIGYLARLTADKGLHQIVDAFIELKKDPQMERARLLIAGWLGEDHRTFAENEFAKLRAAGLEDAYEYRGSVSRAEKLEMLRSIDVLSVPTTYREPKGLYVLEALAAGVPVVQPAHGVFPELIVDTGGGLLVEPNDPHAIAEGLKRVLLDRDQRLQLGQAGRQAVLERRNSEIMAQLTIEAIKPLLKKSD